MQVGTIMVNGEQCPVFDENAVRGKHQILHTGYAAALYKNGSFLGGKPGQRWSHLVLMENYVLVESNNLHFVWAFDAVAMAKRRIGVPIC